MCVENKLRIYLEKTLLQLVSHYLKLFMQCNVQAFKVSEVAHSAILPQWAQKVCM